MEKKRMKSKIISLTNIQFEKKETSKSSKEEKELEEIKKKQNIIVKKNEKNRKRL